MQTAHRAIKIIKREHRGAIEEESRQTAPSLKTQKEIRRAILNTITSWVEQQREAKKESHREGSFFQTRNLCQQVTGGLRKKESEPELL